MWGKLTYMPTRHNYLKTTYFSLRGGSGNVTFLCICFSLVRGGGYSLICKVVEETEGCCAPSRSSVQAGGTVDTPTHTHSPTCWLGRCARRPSTLHSVATCAPAWNTHTRSLKCYECTAYMYQIYKKSQYLIPVNILDILRGYKSTACKSNQWLFEEPALFQSDKM